ncbi:right-handed parallel beta-helix repeat-containing protein [Luteibacter sp. NPDC031894]|uniref:right-handed parallel beta-helix repeat-containing protein n=1 Tax=Luteibacter sp. NPDC031894 TaxID=3390572 RepID=UPI003D08059A
MPGPNTRVSTHRRRFLMGAASVLAGAAIPAVRMAQAMDARSFGARGDGRADDTQALQAVLDAARTGVVVHIPAGVYRIDALRSLRPRPGSSIVLDDGAVLQALPDNAPRSAIIDLTSVSDVSIRGGRLVGNRGTHGGGGEWGHGIRIVSSSRIALADIAIAECWGDGVYVGALGKAGEARPSQDIRLQRVTCSHNRRQGLSITVASDVVVDACTFTDTRGTAPSSGIDIEPQRQGAARGIRVLRSTLSRNDGCGIECSGDVHDLAIVDCVIEGNRTHGVLARGVTGIDIRGCTIRRQGRQGLVLARNVRDATLGTNDVSDNGTQWRATPSGTDPRLNVKIDLPRSPS